MGSTVSQLSKDPLCDGDLTRRQTLALFAAAIGRPSRATHLGLTHLARTDLVRSRGDVGHRHAVHGLVRAA